MYFFAVEKSVLQAVRTEFTVSLILGLLLSSVMVEIHYVT